MTVGFTWNGLRTLGVDEASLATFPEEFRQGMAARAEVLGTTGANHPDNWDGGLASPNLHAIVVLFARDVAERERCPAGAANYLKRAAESKFYPLWIWKPSRRSSTLTNTSATVIGSAAGHRGNGVEPTPGSGPPIKAGEFFLGYPDEKGPAAGMPQPEILSHNGSYVAYLRMEEHVGAFRDFLRAHGETPEQQELVAAKLMGRWRSGAPLVLTPKGTIQYSALMLSATTILITQRWILTAMAARSGHTSGA